MEGEEENEFELEVKQVLDLAELLKKDSNFFIHEAKVKNAAFSPKTNENELSNHERGIKWH